MRLSRFIILLILAASTTLLYTHECVEAVKYSYSIKTKAAEIDNLLDRRERLEYNVARLKSPTYLELKLAKEDVRLVLPERWQVFEVAGIRQEDVRSSKPLAFTRRIANLFALKREAQATPAFE